MRGIWVKFPFKELRGFPLAQMVSSVGDWIPRLKPPVLPKFWKRKARPKDRWEEILRRLDRLNTAELIYLTTFHEMKNPLCVLKTLLQVMSEHLHDPEHCQYVINLSLEEIQKTEGRIQDCLDQNRSGSSRMESVSLEDAARQAGRLLSGMFKLVSIRFHLEAPIDLAKIRGRSELLQRVFLNLFINSIQAMPKGGEIHVYLSNSDFGVEARLMDSGPGIERSHWNHIFNHFYTSKPQGSGLGLFVVRSILNEHGAEIELCKNQGKGAEFRIRFPVHRKESTSNTPRLKIG